MTLDLTEVHSLTDFLRNTKSHISRMKRSKRPLVLTVNGRAELIVQDARSYQALLELADRAEAIEGIRRGLESMARGEGRPAEQVLEELRKNHKIPPRRGSTLPSPGLRVDKISTPPPTRSRTPPAFHPPHHP